MFLWAEGGNLRDFWIRTPNPTITASLVKDIFIQLRGMADALQKLHNFKSGKHYRHGDIKPENILVFPRENNSQTGVLKISDLGSAKHHSVATRLRERTAGKAFATMVYQAPEAIIKKSSASSRLYDIWSLGGVVLEFMVWLLYGYEELKKFNESITGTRGEASPFFVESSVGVAQIHHAVLACFEAMSTRDKECQGQTALGDLLDIVTTKLLVIELPEHTPSAETGNNVHITNTETSLKIRPPFGRRRSSAEELVKALDAILTGKDARNDRYWFTGQSRDNLLLSRLTLKAATGDMNSTLYPGWKPSTALPDRVKMTHLPETPEAQEKLVFPEAHVDPVKNVSTQSRT